MTTAECQVKYLARGNGNQEASIATLQSDYVVFATGHLETVSKPFYEEIRHSDRFIYDPYSRPARSSFQSIKVDETVLIVGSALSAFDAVISLLHHGHDGRIIICSRHANMHKTYPTDHQHDILQVRRPPFLDTDPLDTETVVNGLRAEYTYLKNMLVEQHAIPENIIPERIMKAWEPYVIELVNRMDPKDVQMLFDQYKSLIVTNRTSTVAEIGEVVRSRMTSYRGAPKKVTTISAAIKDMRPINGDTQICVTFAGSREPIVVDRVINALGNNTDYSNARHPLWRSLINETKYGQPHKKTRRGIEVGQHGQLIGSDGSPSDRLFCVGPMRQGDETARRGRLGAFVFSIGTLRNQCFDTAREILRRIGAKSAQDVAMLPDDIHHCLVMSSEWIANQETARNPNVDMVKLKDLLAKHARETLHPIYSKLLMTQKYKDRMMPNADADKELQNLALRITNEFSLPFDDANHLASTLEALVEKHTVHELCDITRLAKWQPSEYSCQVSTGEAGRQMSAA